MKISIHPPLYIYEQGQRANQEDALWPLHLTESDRLFIVCDGMGGHEKGEVASQTVCNALGAWFAQNIKSDAPFTDDMLRQALEYAYVQLDAKDDSGPKKMGTTLTLLYMHSQGITAAHIGDSRIYHIRPFSSPAGEGREGAVLYQSRDHSLVYDLYQSGEITFDEIATHPQRNIITRAMQPGEDNRVSPAIIHITDIRPGDWFYMCSDGMLEQMTNDELAVLLSSDATDEEKRLKLIAATAANKDNHTALLIHISTVTNEEGDEQLINEEPTARCNALNIKPLAPVTDEPDVVETSDDDVTMIPSPEQPKKRRKLNFRFNRRNILYLATMAVAVVVLAFLLFCSGGSKSVKPVLQKKESSAVPLQKPDTKAKQSDTINNLTGNNHGNQHTVNATRGNDSARNIQNR